jgi:tRNA(Phe) wybutosine-synthesizing methylase Tyw3
MASGKQIAAENIAKFNAWVEERRSAEDWKDYVRAGRMLNRTEIANECGFAKSVLRQNPTVKTILEVLEEELIDSGILSRNDNNEGSIEASQLSGRAIDQRIISINGKAEQRIKVLEEQNAALKAEVMELRSKIKRFELIEKHLTETGRMVRP